MSPPTPLSPTSEARAQRIRQELKEWEHTFADAHDGRKPSKQEARANKEIAAKYKEYSDLCYPKPKPPIKSQPSQPTSTPSKAIRRPAISSETPKKQTSAQFKTPQKPATPRTEHMSSPGSNVGSPSVVYDSPHSLRRARLFGHIKRDFVGPTPQKNGRVLGIFESIFSSPTSADAALQSPRNNVSTPRKRKAGEISGDPVTPSKSKEEKKERDPLDTPDCLKYRPVMGDTPMRLARSKRPKALSVMLREEREREDKMLDDEEAILREMEMEAAGVELVKKVVKTNMLFQDEEVIPKPPGAWEEEGKEADIGEKEPEGRKWKKKGLKRQTRRVKMKPVFVKPGEAPAEVEENDSEVEGASDAEGSDFKDKDNEEHDDATPKKKQKLSKTEDVKPKKKKSVAKKGKEAVKKTVRKVSSTAHANYRKLNIKNKNSKGKGEAGKKWFKRRG